MSKQTINIGASPNDGTGTPLRTSFDYTNQNFTELYTALGGGVGLPGATTQVIFNDGGTNLAGDAGLVYNKTTDALTVAGLVTAGSATITGAATVGTTLGVTGNLSAAANSILGTGSKATDTLLDFSADTGTQRIYLDRGGRNLIFKDVTTNIENYRITGVTGVHTWGVGGSTAMTLNSFGLGMGVVPSAWSNPYKCVQLSGGSLSVYPTTDLYISQNAYNSGGWKRVAAGYASQYIQTNSEHRFLIAGTSPTVDSAIAFTQAMTLDASGNLLVGTVTAPAGTKVGAIAKLSGVSLEGTAAISVSTTPVALAKSLGTGGLFFVTGYNTSGGSQCWFLVASQSGLSPTVISSQNSTGLTVAFTTFAGIVYMNTVSGTIAVNVLAITN